MKTTEVPYYEIRLYIGSREGYHGDKFSKRELMKAVRDFTNERDRENMVSVRLTKCTYQVGDWDENGWEIAAINYPRFPKSQVYLREWFDGLATFLLEKLKQNRITVCDPYHSRTIERDGAEQTR